MINAEQPNPNTERQLYLRRFADMGILFQIQRTVAREAGIEEEDAIDSMVCLPVWFQVEQHPNSQRDLQQVLGEGAHIPELVIHCSWSAISGGRRGYSLSAFDEELSLDPTQIQQIELWASEREPLVFRC